MVREVIKQHFTHILDAILDRVGVEVEEGEMLMLTRREVSMCG